MEGATQYWQQWLPLVQVSMNNAITSRTQSAPFSLMFARSINECKDYIGVKINHNEGVIESIKKKNDEFNNAVKPGIIDKTKKYNTKVRQDVDKKRKIVKELAPGTVVYALDKLRGTKWEPKFEGPFTVIRQNKGGAYILKDTIGKMKRKFTIDMLKVAKLADVKDELQHAEIERIIKHRRRKGLDQYYVKWKNCPKEENEWLHVKDFDDISIITKFWKSKVKKIT